MLIQRRTSRSGNYFGFLKKTQQVKEAAAALYGTMVQTLMHPETSAPFFLMCATELTKTGSIRILLEKLRIVTFDEAKFQA